MANVVFLRFILCCIASSVSFFSFLLLRGLALLVILAVRALKVPGTSIRGSWDQVTCVLRSVIEQVLSIVGQFLTSTLSNLIDVLTSTATGSVKTTASITGEMVDKLWSLVVEVMEAFPEIFDGVKEMASKVVIDLLVYSKDTLGFVMENITGS